MRLARVFLPFLVALPAIWHSSIHGQESPLFSGDRAFELVARQMEFGPRPTGSEANRLLGNWILSHLEELGWEVSDDLHPVDLEGDTVLVRNLVASRGEGDTIIIGAHYDTRLLADNDPDPSQRSLPVPGANDGASGVAVLLELARVFSRFHRLGAEIRLVFFDAEDNGLIRPWNAVPSDGAGGWIIGSSRYAENLDLEQESIRFMILVDLVGDMDQRMPKEGFSDFRANRLTSELWDLAQRRGYGEHFIQFVRSPIIDDHLPFLNRGIPAVNIIDLDYPHWHTTQDTLDKIDADSLERVGRLVQEYLREIDVISTPRPPRPTRIERQTGKSRPPNEG